MLVLQRQVSADHRALAPCDTPARRCPGIATLPRGAHVTPHSPGRDNGVQAIENMMKKTGRFDYVLLETTGLADPGPIASIFWIDDALQAQVHIDGVVTMVDAKYGLQQLREKRDGGVICESVRQVALADRIIVNKTDLVSPAVLAELTEEIRKINTQALILETTKAK